MFVGWGLARSGDLGGARETLGKLRGWAAEAELNRIADQGGGSAAARSRFADVVEGTIAAEEDRVSDARRLLGPSATMSQIEGSLARAALAEVELAQGNVAEAVRHYSGNLYTYQRPHAVRALARIHEERGDVDQARAYYESFLTITREGEQDLPEIVEAKEALARLGG